MTTPTPRTRLNGIKYYVSFNPGAAYLATDGSFGSATRNAVIAYQGNRTILNNGIVGPQTWAVACAHVKLLDDRYRSQRTRVALVAGLEAGC